MGYYSPASVKTKVVKSLWFNNAYKIKYKIGVWGIWKTLRAAPHQYSIEASRLPNSYLSDTLLFLDEKVALRIAAAFKDEDDISFHNKIISDALAKKKQADHYYRDSRNSFSATAT